ncbi:MAG TPA: histidine kinase [Gemmatimonadaceae bacterium]|nr:histidine kinase [Gemmatimonadaceae bacterium]
MIATTIPVSSAPAPIAAEREHDAVTGDGAAARPLWRWLAYDFVAWAMVALMFAVQAWGRGNGPFARLVASQEVSFLPCALFTPLIAFVALRYRFTDERGPWRAVAAHLACLLAFLVLGAMMMGALEWSLPWEPYGAGVAAAMRSAVGRYAAIDVILYVTTAAAALALAYGRESREREVRAARLQARLAEAQLHALGAQLHPHFLFNTLHAISALVRPEPKRAEQLIARLSELLREMLDNRDRAEVTLGEELAFLEKYVDIQEARFGPRLRVTFEVAPAALDARVPRLVLQPLVENAVRHGVSRRLGAGTIAIAAACDDDRLTLTVRDDGAGLPRGEVHDGVGLSITRARLRQLYGTEQEFTIAPAAGGGTVCVVRIPCRRGQPLQQQEDPS